MDGLPGVDEVPRRTLVPRDGLYLWDGDEDITAQFVIDEREDATRISGPFERLTAYSVRPDKTLSVNIGAGDRDVAAQAARRGELFYLEIPNHYVRWT